MPAKLAIKSMLRRIFDWRYGPKIEFYLKAVEDRYRKLSPSVSSQVDALSKYDEHLLDFHIGSAAKAPNLLKVKIRLASTKDFVERCVGTIGPNDAVVDVGAASGVFLQMLGKSEMAVEAWKPALELLRQAGIAAVEAGKQGLPFANDRFDYGFALETLEHVSDPIGALQDMGRVCQKGVFISIPYRETSRVVAPKVGGRATGHIFELSHGDFKRMATHCGLVVRASESVWLQDRGAGIEYFLRRRSGFNKPSVWLFYLTRQ
jgi:SAM-dependent methyltransferase